MPSMNIRHVVERVERWLQQFYRQSSIQHDSDKCMLYGCFKMLYIKGEKLEPKQRRAVLKDRRLQHIKPEQINDYAFLIMKSGRLMPPQAKQTIKLPPAIPVAERRAGNQKIDQLMGCTKRRFNT